MNSLKISFISENRLTAVRGEGGWGLGEKGEGIMQKTKNKKTPHSHREQYGDYQRERWVGEGRRE